LNDQTPLGAVATIITEATTTEAWALVCEIVLPERIMGSGGGKTGRRADVKNACLGFNVPGDPEIPNAV
jgi:hypothetical protein